MRLQRSHPTLAADRYLIGTWYHAHATPDVPPYPGGGETTNSEPCRVMAATGLTPDTYPIEGVVPLRGRRGCDRLVPTRWGIRPARAASRPAGKAGRRRGCRRLQTRPPASCRSPCRCGHRRGRWPGRCGVGAPALRLAPGVSAVPCEAWSRHERGYRARRASIPSWRRSKSPVSRWGGGAPPHPPKPRGMRRRSVSAR